MTDQMKLVARRVVGILLIVVGIMGMILPVMPGVWFIPLGLSLLGFRMVINRKKPWHQMIRLRRKKH